MTEVETVAEVPVLIAEALLEVCKELDGFASFRLFSTFALFREADGSPLPHVGVGVHQMASVSQDGVPCLETVCRVAFKFDQPVHEIDPFRTTRQVTRLLRLLYHDRKGRLHSPDGRCLSYALRRFDTVVLDDPLQDSDDVEYTVIDVSFLTLWRDAF